MKTSIRAPRVRPTNRGTALLAVLWLSAALAAIAFAMSVTVRGETDRAATGVDDLRSYYLASAGAEKAAMELLWSAAYGVEKRLIPKGSPYIDYDFPSGIAHVEIIPETAKINVNKTSLGTLVNLLVALGVDPQRAVEIGEAIFDWRSPSAPGSELDSYYLSLIPSFLPPHASLEEIEELLLVKGVTPDLFYGTWAPAPAGPAAGRLVWHAGLIDCLTVYGTDDPRVDVNTAEPAVLAAVGVEPAAIEAIVEHRLAYPTDEHMLEFANSVGAGGRLRAEGNAMVTFRSTARLRLSNGQLSDMRRTVGAQVKFMVFGSPTPYDVLRWYDTAWSN
jgi:general secretion pathway protein K